MTEKELVKDIIDGAPNDKMEVDGLWLFLHPKIYLILAY